MIASKTNCYFFLVLMSSLLYANSADSEIVANLDFFMNYEYLEYADVHQEDESHAVTAQDIEQLSNLGLESKPHNSPEEQR